MTAALVYLLMLKAIATSFAGMGSLPQIQHDFVETRHALSADELNRAVLLGRSTPGPVGSYVVAVGYFAAGWSGAVAAWLAMVTPALAAIPLYILMQRWLHLPRVRAAVDAVVIASAVLLLSQAYRMAVDGTQQLTRAVAGL